MANIAILGPKDDGTAFAARCVLLILSWRPGGRLSNAQDMLHLGHHFDGRQR